MALAELELAGRNLGEIAASQAELHRLEPRRGSPSPCFRASGRTGKRY
jgi:hypothetical protein